MVGKWGLGAAWSVWGIDSPIVASVVPMGLAVADMASSAPPIVGNIFG